jgi:hypothetical protein
MAREMFRTAGNPFRHGSANDGEHRQVLFDLGRDCCVGFEWLLE